MVILWFGLGIDPISPLFHIDIAFFAGVEKHEAYQGVGDERALTGFIVVKRVCIKNPAAGIHDSEVMQKNQPTLTERVGTEVIRRISNRFGALPGCERRVLRRIRDRPGAGGMEQCKMKDEK